MRIACIGGGPGGLFFSILMKRHMPDAQVVLFERNKASDAFGFGVVFSDDTLRRITEADPVLKNALDNDGCHWGEIDVWLKDEQYQFSGNGMSAIHRKSLLSALQQRAAEAGVEMHFDSAIKSAAELEDFDLIVAADGTNSGIRREVGEAELDHEVVDASAKFIWFGTTHMFEGLTFVHRKNEHGNFAAHAYPISDKLSTFIVETDEETWRAAGLDEFDATQPPGISDMKSKAYIEELFAADLNGAEIVVNNSRWGNFRTRSTGSWFHDKIAFLGDAIHTAHFSVGSGTKMAMEDAIVLAQAVAESPDDLSAALQTYEDERKPKVARVQSAAGPSLSWWEHFGRYHNTLDPLQFTIHFFTRSLGLDKVRQRDPQLVRAAEDAWADLYEAAPLQTPITLGDTTFPGRLLSLDDQSIRLDTHVLSLTAADIQSVRAPENEAEVQNVAKTLPNIGTVLIRGGTALTRRLLSEEARMVRGLTTVLVEDTDEVAAATAVLSGRADAVAVGV